MSAPGAGDAFGFGQQAADKSVETPALFGRREADRCRREGIVLNIFLLPSWSQTEEDVRFAHRMAESTGGRVLFVGGEELDRFVVWDYVRMRRTIL